MISKSGVTVEVGSKWEMVAHKGSTLQPLKVIGFADQWVVMRRKCCNPICAHINTFGAEYVTK